MRMHCMHNIDSVSLCVCCFHMNALFTVGYPKNPFSALEKISDYDMKKLFRSIAFIQISPPNTKTLTKVFLSNLLQ